MAMLFVFPCGAVRASPSCITDSTTPVRKRLRGRVAYDGTNYNGWQFQENGRTIQAEIEKVLRRRFGHPVRVVGASRTDTGVHARGQAFHVDVPIEFAPSDDQELYKLEFVINQMLPDDVRVMRLGHAPYHRSKRFEPSLKDTGDLQLIERTHLWSAMYDATGKSYSYSFSVAPVLDPMLRLYCYREWRVAKFGFSEQRLHDAAARFVGTHDFTAFANSCHKSQGIKSPVEINPMRTIRSIEIVNESPDRFRLEFSIDGAFYKMIRNIMGTLLDISCFQLDVDSVDRFLESRDRRIVPKSAPARGLCLEQVFYDGWDM